MIVMAASALVTTAIGALQVRHMLRREMRNEQREKDWERDRHASPHRHRPTGRGGATPRRPGCPIMAGTARNGDGPAGRSTPRPPPTAGSGNPMTGHDHLAGRIVGHEPGAFYNRLAKTLGGYVHEVLAELARQGVVQADAEGQPVVRVCEASAILVRGADRRGSRHAAHRACRGYAAAGDLGAGRGAHKLADALRPAGHDAVRMERGERRQQSHERVVAGGVPAISWPGAARPGTLTPSPSASMGNHHRRGGPVVPNLMMIQRTITVVMSQYVPL